MLSTGQKYFSSQMEQIPILKILKKSIPFNPKKIRFNRDISFRAKSRLQMGIRTDVRISRISPIRTDFFRIPARNPSKKQKKSVRIGEIREIRTPIRIPMYSQSVT
ncbi:MAG: hypothetical protein RLZZ628_2448 [Bacteroidota bacterium]|jgi:hypothetical protein